ncbi:uncharacterized protein LOC114310019 isoform X2 [Camellia sinensis]|uniref:uncharacterized protein LOC114310019 isoform X2 n=1 Tax=Camellia sinensis TaxID=4442 RepID=UPI001035FF87|nr:uncharacterized protein LOC114310019 isoform X2 [Camellia sinensis]
MNLFIVGLNMGSTNMTKLTVSLILMVEIWALNFNEIEGGPTTTFTSSPLGRSLLQAVNISEPMRQSDDTVRVDPLNHFKKYRGGYDITNKHYWSSAIFTGIYGYAIGVLWLLCGLVNGGFLLATSFCCKNSNRKLKKKKGSHCHKQCYPWPILLATFFTVLAIVATGLVLGGNAKFHSRAKKVVDIVINTANDASQTIYNTTGAMKDISTNLEVSNGSSSYTGLLTSTSQKLDSEAAVIQRQAKKNRHAINKGLKIVYILTVVIISFNLVAVLALSVFGILRLQRALYVFIVLCWLLTILCWFFFGVYFFIEKFEGDTCTALEDFQRDPYNSSLSSILPCNELLSAKSALSDVSAGIYNLVNEVNANISTSYQNIVQVCNPFSEPPEYQYQPNSCPSNTIKIGDIPRVLKTYTCSDANSGTCEGVLISTNDFRTVEAYSNSIQTLLNAYPGMENLVQCQPVEEAFSEILQRHCKPLKRHTRMVWAALLFLSIIMVAVVLIWTVEAHYQQKRQFSDCSVKSHSMEAELMESGGAKGTRKDSNLNSVL